MIICYQVVVLSTTTAADEGYGVQGGEGKVEDIP
jgi:hypothetical protein